MYSYARSTFESVVSHFAFRRAENFNIYFCNRCPTTYMKLSRLFMDASIRPAAGGALRPNRLEVTGSEPLVSYLYELGNSSSIEIAPNTSSNFVMVTT